MVRCTVVILAVFGLITGLNAARLWWQSSKVPVDPGWRVEPGNFEMAASGWQGATIRAMIQSGNLNRDAAVWTAISVALNAASAFVSATFCG